MVLICIFLLTNNTEHLFMCFLDICKTFGGKYLFKSLPICSSCVSFWVVRVLYVFWIQIPSQIYDLQIFSYILWVVSSLFWQFLWKFLIFQSNLSVFPWLLVVPYLKKLPPNPKSWRVTPMCPSKRLMLLALIFTVSFCVNFKNMM